MTFNTQQRHNMKEYLHRRQLGLHTFKLQISITSCDIPFILCCEKEYLPSGFSLFLHICHATLFQILVQNIIKDKENMRKHKTQLLNDNLPFPWHNFITGCAIYSSNQIVLKRKQKLMISLSGHCEEIWPTLLCGIALILPHWRAIRHEIPI